MQPENSDAELKVQLSLCFPKPTEETHQMEDTVEGLKALEDGTMIMKNASKSAPKKKYIEKELKPLQRVYLLFGCQYRRMFQDPRLLVLFDITDEDANVSAYQHGRRLGALFLQRWTGEFFYEGLGRGYRLDEAHEQAKKCPLRGEKWKGKNFTDKQRNAWLGHFWAACAEMNFPKHFQQTVSFHLAQAMKMYRPYSKQ